MCQYKQTMQSSEEYIVIYTRNKTVKLYIKSKY